jgi:membrane protease YdiL (CAAX protease family)
MAKHTEARSPFTFLVLTIALTWLIWLPSIVTGLIGDFGFDAEAYNLVSNIIGAFCPLIVAMALVVRRHGWGQSWVFVRQAFDFRTKPIYFVLALAIPLGLNVLAHYLAPIFNLEVADSMMGLVVPEGTSTPLVVLMVFAYFFLILFFGGGQEEFGWRGYAQQPLQARYGILNASLIIGVVWGLWHAPLWIMPGDGHSTYSFLAFLLMITSQAVVYGWLYNASGQKLIIPLLFHAMQNTAPGPFPVLHMIPGKPETAYWIYAGVNILAGMIAAYYIRKDQKQNEELQ